MIEEFPIAGGDVEVDVLEAAAEQLREEVLALKQLGARHAELKSQIRHMNAELDALAHEYQSRYRQLAGGQVVNTALRELGMGESLAGAVATRRRRTPKPPAADPGDAGATDAVTS